MNESEDMQQMQHGKIFNRILERQGENVGSAWNMQRLFPYRGQKTLLCEPRRNEGSQKQDWEKDDETLSRKMASTTIVKICGQDRPNKENVMCVWEEGNRRTSSRLFKATRNCVVMRKTSSRITQKISLHAHMKEVIEKMR